MDNEDLKKYTCINLRCVTQSSKGGVPLNQLQNDYRQLLGSPIPFKDLGYDSLENFLRDIPDVICLKKSSNGSVFVEGVADASTAHIAKLISKQKSSKKSKSGSTKPDVVTRKWGSFAKKSSRQSLKSPLKDFNSFSSSIFDRKHEQDTKLTLAQQELKKSVLVNLRSVVQSCKEGVPLNRLQYDYKKFIGSYIPFEKLGYSTLYEFIQSIPDVINLKKGVNEQFIAIGVVDATTAHLFGDPLKPMPSKTVPPPNKLSKSLVNNSTTLQNSSEQKAESPSFFKLPPNKVDISDLNSILKYSPTQKKAKKKNGSCNSVPDVLSKDKKNRASKEELIKPESLKVAEPVFSYEENSSSEVPASKTDATLCQNQNKIFETIGSSEDIKTSFKKNPVTAYSKKAEKNARRKAKQIQNQIEMATLSPLVWMNFILYGPTKIKILRKKVLSFYGFPFSSDSKAWKEKINLLSLMPKKALLHCLHLLGIEYDCKDTKESFQHKLIDFLAAYTEDSETNMQETIQEDNEKELYASTLTLSSISSDILSKCSSYADTETSDAILNDKNFVASKTQCEIVSDSHFIELPLDKQSLSKKISHCLEETKEPVGIEKPNEKRNLNTERYEGIQSEKICKTKHYRGEKSELQKPSATEEIRSALQKQQSLDKNSFEQKVHDKQCSETETSSLVSSKSAKRKRKRERKKTQIALKNIGSSETQLSICTYAMVASSGNANS